MDYQLQQQSICIKACAKANLSCHLLKYDIFEWESRIWINFAKMKVIKLKLEKSQRTAGSGIGLAFRRIMDIMQNGCTNEEGIEFKE